MKRPLIFFACLPWLRLVALAAFVVPAPVCAAPQPAGEQMEVTAEESLEWYQETRLYVARGAAKAVRGDTVITAESQHSAAGYTPYEGFRTRGSIAQVYLRGQLAAENGAPKLGPAGVYIPRKPGTL